MWLHLLNLLGRSWSAMVGATGTSTLGIMVWLFLVAAACWLATVLAKTFEYRQRNVPRPFVSALRTSVRIGIYTGILLGSLVIMAFSVSVVVTVYRNQQALVSENKRWVLQNKLLESALEQRKHSIDTADPVFANTIYLLQAFSIYRQAMKGARCLIYVTAAPGGEAMASMVAQFSHSVSGCYTFGPDMNFEMNPSLEREAVDGMVADAVVFHAPSDDRPADQLFGNLSNQMRLKRSYALPHTPRYRIPDKGEVHVVWLQFGTRVKWNSDSRP